MHEHTLFLRDVQWSPPKVCREDWQNKQDEHTLR